MKRILNDLITDMLAIAGVGLVGWAFWQMYQPAAVMWLGMILLWLAWSRVRHESD